MNIIKWFTSKRKRQSDNLEINDIQQSKMEILLEEHHVKICPDCGHGISWGDMAWNNVSTESGTPYATLEILCMGCDREIAKAHTWYPDIENADDILYILEYDTDWYS